MFDRTEIIVGLEIGTAKVCAVVGELSEDEGLHVIGLGQSPTAGAVRKGRSSMRKWPRTPCAPP